MSIWVAIVFAVLTGVFTSLEATINSNLGKIITPKVATLHSLVTGTAVIFFINMIKGSLSEYSKILHVKPIYLIGGIFGAFIIYFLTKTVPKLGVANTLTIVVASQITSGLLIDIFILREVEFDLYKLFGIVLLLFSIYYIVR